MKKLIIVLMALALVAGFAGVSMAAIGGSAHDFSTSGWSGGQLCLPCHTPHNADSAAAGSPLWNHEVTTGPFIQYASGTINAIMGDPAGVSKLCLSCHDGTVALDSYGGDTGSTNIPIGANLGTDMSDDHPVSFTYDDTLAAIPGIGLNQPSTTVTAIGGFITEDLLVATNQMECSSCHDVHNHYNVSPLLKITNASSALCLTCHDK